MTPDLPLSAGRYRLERAHDAGWALHASPVDVRFDTVRWYDDGGRDLELRRGDETAALIDQTRLPPALRSALKDILVDAEVHP